METPIRGKDDKKGFVVPETPALQRLGYGTGIGVYQLERSPNANGMPISPWALKKVLRTHKHSTYNKLLKDEAKILRQLKHPNIIGFRGMKTLDDGRTAIAMEKCSQCLGDMNEMRYEAKLGPYPVENILKVARDMAEALRYLHDEVHLLHGDIKSFNILINGDFEVAKLCDFGVSVRLDPQSGRALGEYVGTNCWSAPEVLHDNDPSDVTAKSDIWALGVTLWEMLALVPPHLPITESFYDADGSLNLDESSFMDHTQELYGTRPALPDVKLGQEYKIVIDLFESLTESDPRRRPSAKEILDLLPK